MKRIFLPLLIPVLLWLPGCEGMSEAQKDRAFEFGLGVAQRVVDQKLAPVPQK